MILKPIFPRKVPNLIRLVDTQAFHQCVHNGALWSEVNEKVKKPNNKPSRQDRINKINMTSQSKLYHINNEFNIFNNKVTKILDLGFAPGNWLAFSKLKMCEVYGLEETNINKKCNFLGFDLLISTPPVGTSTLQGNIFSKASHLQIIEQFKEFALKKLVNELPEETSYFVTEQSDSLIEKDLGKIEEGMSKLALGDNEASAEDLDYKPELILSDLSKPFIQEKGFYQNTNTRPHLRINSNPALSQVVLNSKKSSIDMADATLVLCCDLLKKGGTLVLRLASVDIEDPELDIVGMRLQRVFEEVHLRQVTESGDLFFICLDKKRDVADKKNVFKL